MTINSFDSFDKSILQNLQEHGRMTNQELAERIGLSATPCQRRVKQLEAKQVIQGYRAILCRQELGLGLTVFLEIKVEGHGREGMSSELRHFFAAMPEVVSLHILSGRADFLLEVTVPNLAAYEFFLLEKLLKNPSIKEVQSNFAIRTIKSQAPLPLDHLNPSS